MSPVLFLAENLGVRWGFSYVNGSCFSASIFCRSVEHPIIRRFVRWPRDWINHDG